MSIMPTKSPSSVKYENNPFFVAATGLTLLFDLARGVLIFLAALAFANMFVSYATPDYSQETDRAESINHFTELTGNWLFSDWLLAGFAVFIVIFAILMVSALFGGVSAYTSAQLARGKKANLVEAFHVAFDNLWSFLWLQVIVGVKLLLWTLLFVLPGVYMAFRYSLAQVAFFDEKKNLRGNAAIKESLRLTKGAWVTTFASNFLFNALTFGGFVGVISTGVNAVLYRQFDHLSVKPKPAAHWLSWLTIALPVSFFVLIFLFLIALVIGIAIAGPTAP